MQPSSTTARSYPLLAMAFPDRDALRPASRILRAAGAAIFALLVLGLSGCASDRAPRSNSQTPETPYVGVFTGQFIDGLPLYRFPSIEVIGSRRSVTPELREPNGS